jgi:hypothetical protein
MSSRPDARESGRESRELLQVLAAKDPGQAAGAAFRDDVLVVFGRVVREVRGQISF